MKLEQKKKKIKHFLVFITIVVFSFSCIPKRKFVYFKNDKVQSDTFRVAPKFVYKLQKEDILKIDIKVLDFNTPQDFFKKQGAVGGMRGGRLGGGGLLNPDMQYVVGYTVNDTGYIELPSIGLMKAENKTIDQLRNDILTEAKKLVVDVAVDVKLASFRISFLGEFNSRGTKFIARPSINMLELLALAGGMSDVADRTKVRLIRQVGDSTFFHYLDFSQPELIHDDFYWAKPNDIYYAEPKLDAKLTRKNLSTLTFAIGIVTTVLTFGIFIINLSQRG